MWERRRRGVGQAAVRVAEPPGQGRQRGSARAAPARARYLSCQGRATGLRSLWLVRFASDGWQWHRRNTGPSAFCRAARKYAEARRAQTGPCWRKEIADDRRNLALVRRGVAGLGKTAVR